MQVKVMQQSQKEVLNRNVNVLSQHDEIIYTFRSCALSMPVLVRKGLLTNEEVLEEIKAVRREMEGKRGR